MDTNCYALEVITKARLAELRADAARNVALVPEPGSGLEFIHFRATCAALAKRFRGLMLDFKT